MRQHNNKKPKRIERETKTEAEGGQEVVRHIKMDQAATGVEKQRVIERTEREEVWKSSHDEMDSTGP